MAKNILFHIPIIQIVCTVIIHINVFLLLAKQNLETTVGLVLLNPILNLYFFQMAKNISIHIPIIQIVCTVIIHINIFLLFAKKIWEQHLCWSSVILYYTFNYFRWPKIFRYSYNTNSLNGDNTYKFIPSFSSKNLGTVVLVFLNPTLNLYLFKMAKKFRYSYKTNSLHGDNTYKCISSFSS